MRKIKRSIKIRPKDNKFKYHLFNGKSRTVVAPKNVIPCLIKSLLETTFRWNIEYMGHRIIERDLGFNVIVTEKGHRIVF